MRLHSVGPGPCSRSSFRSLSQTSRQPSAFATALFEAFRWPSEEAPGSSFHSMPWSSGQQTRGATTCHREASCGTARPQILVLEVDLLSKQEVGSTLSSGRVVATPLSARPCASGGEPAPARLSMFLSMLSAELGEIVPAKGSQAVNVWRANSGRSGDAQFPYLVPWVG